MALFTTCTEYINCSINIKVKIARIDNIIEALEDAELQNATENGTIQEYSLDDGQTKIKEIFKDLNAIERAITSLERRKQRLINRCFGYRYSLMDGNIKIR